MIIHGLFPIAVATFNYDKGLTQSEKDLLMSHEIHRNKGNSTSVDRYVLNDERLTALRSFIDRCIKKYVESVYAPSTPFNLPITQSWLNYTEKGGHHHIHWHPNSMISGVFYINADGNTDKIFFDKQPRDSFKIFTDKPNALNIDTVWMSVNTNDLILFPSYLMHRVEEVESVDTRVSLAFNTFPAGTLGSHDALNKVVIKEIG
jgi:uncharacterized protein (TIGR02466 family)